MLRRGPQLARHESLEAVGRANERYGELRQRLLQQGFTDDRCATLLGELGEPFIELRLAAHFDGLGQFALRIGLALVESAGWTHEQRRDQTRGPRLLTDGPRTRRRNPARDAPGAKL